MANASELLMVLSRCKGAANGKSVETLSILCRCSAREVRKMVEELRMEGQHVCAHPTAGYYMAANDEELNETCDFLYARAMTSLNQISAMKRVSLPDLRGQLRLPT